MPYCRVCNGTNYAAAAPCCYACSKPSRFTTGEPGRDVAAWEHLLWQLLIESYVVQVGLALAALCSNEPTAVRALVLVPAKKTALSVLSCCKPSACKDDRGSMCKVL
jgi:hypothetical protein